MASLTPRLRRSALLCVGVSIVLLLGTSSVVYADIDLSGTAATDQTAATSSEVVAPLIAPQPASVNGQSVGQLTTDIMSADETDAPYDLQIYTSTGSGTSALTGVVTDSATGSVLPGASVTMQASAGGSATTVTADANGGFAFVNIPVGTSGTPYTLNVSAQGYGSYSVTNQTYQPDTTYETTAELTTSAQSYDASQIATQGAQVTSAAGDLAPYTSYRRPPPTIKVAMYTHGANCTRGSSTYTVKTFPFRFYSLHVAVGEISTAWHHVPWKSVALAITNYAWYFKRHPPAPDYNVDNTTAFQCFLPGVSIPTVWHGWMNEVLQSHFANSSGDTHITQYRAGSYECTDPNFPQNGDKLSQQGARAKYNLCGVTYYQDIDNYYYVGSFANSTTPPIPNTSYSRPSGAVKLTFPAQVQDSSGHTSNVGWTYTVEKFETNLPTPHWIIIYQKGWSNSSRSVPTSFTYGTSHCYQYRVKASNPIGSSSYGSFNNGNAICPG